MFDPVSIIKGVAAPLRMADVDTDVIIRIERLTSGDLGEIGRWAFEAVRYRPDGTEDPDFVLNQAPFRGAPILLAGRNFGCGSSREAAVTSLRALGIRCVIAESFGDIFYANCFQNGLLPIRLAAIEILALMEEADRRSAPFVVNLVEQRIVTPTGAEFHFEIDPQRREALITGLDDIELTQRENAAIAVWQAQDERARPWIWQVEDHQ